MRDESLEDITKFLARKRIALVGVSRNSRHFSRALLGEFLAKGYDVIPVNPNATEVEGRKCFARVSEITPTVEAVLLLTGATDITNHAVCECSEAGIRHIWVYKSVKHGEDHTQALESCRLRGAAIIEGHCPFMFLPHPALIHRVHRFISKAVGNYPQ